MDLGPTSKVLFLDIDGVLNSGTLLGKTLAAFEKHLKDSTEPMDESSPALKSSGLSILMPVKDHKTGHAHPGMVLSRPNTEDLVSFVRENGIRVVISSTWRFTAPDELYALFGPDGYDVLHEDWRTPYGLSNVIRGDEVNLWLNKHPNTEYVILDDDSDFTPKQKSHLVQTEYTYGMNRWHLSECRSKLRR